MNQAVVQRYFIKGLQDQVVDLANFLLLAFFGRAHSQIRAYAHFVCVASQANQHGHRAILIVRTEFVSYLFRLRPIFFHQGLSPFGSLFSFFKLRGSVDVDVNVGVFTHVVFKLLRVSR